MKVMTARGDWADVANVNAASGFLEGGVADDGSSRTIELLPGPDGTGRHKSYRKVYESTPWLWSSFHLISRGFGRMPAKVYTVNDEGHKTRVRPDASTPAGSLAAALRRPGGRRSWQANQHATSIDRNVEGAGIWFIERDRFGLYTGFTRVPFRFVRYEERAGVPYYWDSRKPKVRRLADDVIHFGAYQEDVLWSPSCIAAMPATLQLFDAIQRHLVGFFRNSARPSGHVEVDRSTTLEQRRLIRTAITEMYSGPDNAGRVLVTSGKWSPITQNNDHTQIIELIKLVREEMVSVVGVPGPLVGILDRAIMANVRELRSHYARDVMGPHVSEWEGDIDAQLVAADPLLVRDNVAVEIEQAAVLKADTEARAKGYKDRRYVETPNEIRATENLEPIKHPRADMVWMPLAEAPINEGADDDDDDLDPANPDPQGNPDDET